MEILQPFKSLLRNMSYVALVSGVCSFFSCNLLFLIFRFFYICKAYQVCGTTFSEMASGGLRASSLSTVTNLKAGGEMCQIATASAIGYIACVRPA